MGTKLSYIEKLRAIGKEYEVKLTNEEWVKERLRWEDWETHYREAVALAVRLLKGRGRRRVLPGGYDAQSIAAQVIADMLDGKGGMVGGWTRERLVKRVEWLVRAKIRSLERLKETSVTGSEWVRSCNGQELSLLEREADPGANAYEAVAAREKEEQREDLKGRLEAMLGADPVAKAVFDGRWEGLTNPAEIAKRLGMDEKAVVRARKRL
ncbi:MAG: hypothetical protein ACREIC_19965, partial [Limisphaerales bacterium]